jgi:ankyrin repeat protein
MNAASEIQGTPLHIAVASGHRDIVELLVTRGADVNVKDRMGQTPLDMAKQKRQTEIIDLLLAHGAQE